MKKLIYVLLAAAIAFGMAGCPNDSTDTPTGGGGITVAITGGTGNIAPGSTRQFRATINGVTSTAVTWSLTGKGSSTTTNISTAGLLSVDANETTNTVLTITATSTADTTKSASINVTVQTGAQEEKFSVKFYDFKSDDTLFTGSGKTPTLLKTIDLEDGQSIEAAGKTLPRNPVLGSDWKFKEWVKEGGGVVTVDSDFPAAINVYGTYYDGVFRGPTSGGNTPLEKVYLENATLAVYQFDISSKVTGSTTAKDVIKALKGIKASYGVSEAGALDATRLRVYGPYFFSATPTTLAAASAGNAANSVFFGDFKSDRNSALAARHDGTASTPETFNKFQAYLLNGAGDAAISTLGTANSWFDVEYDFDPTDDGTSAIGSGYSYGKTMRYLDTILDDGKALDGTTQVLPAGTDYTKVYFAIGLWRGNAGQVVNTTSSIWDHGRVFLVKDIQLILGDDTTATPSRVNGTVPQLAMPAHTQVFATTGADASGAIAAKTVSQVFSGYIDPVVGSWRGAVGDPVPTITAPGWQPPQALPAADTHIVINLAADPSLIKLFNNSTTPEPNLLSIANGVVSVNLTASDIGGWKGITFDIPDAWGTSSWDHIRLDYDCTIDTDISEGRAQFSAKGGRATDQYPSPALPNLTVTSVGAEGNPGAYPNPQNGLNKRFTVAGDANLGSAAGAYGITLQLNNNAATNVPQKYTITFKTLTLRAP